VAQEWPVRRPVRKEQRIVSLGVVVHVAWEKKQPFVNS
jgi:hypothetical protein